MRHAPINRVTMDFKVRQVWDAEYDDVALIVSPSQRIILENAAAKDKAKIIKIVGPKK